MKLPPDLMRRVLALAGEKPAAKPRREKVELLPASHPSPGVWVVPFAAASEANARAWKGRHARAGQAWKAVRAAVGPLHNLLLYEYAIACGKPVRARFVRLGGKRLDRLVNLPASLKGVEDAFAFLLGVDDGSPLWVPSCDQEPGGAFGVRVELEAKA